MPSEKEQFSAQLAPKRASIGSLFPGSHPEASHSKGKTMKARLFCLALLCISPFAFASTLRAAPPIGAIVQDTYYDSAKDTVTVKLLNTSQKYITAIDLSVRLTHPDGTVSMFGYGGDFLPYMTQAVELGQAASLDQGVGAFAPGATLAMNVPAGQQAVQAASVSVDVVVYVDDTADVLNEQQLEIIASQRTGRMLGLRKANELLQTALADPNDPHPSVTVAAQLEALAKQPNPGEPNPGMGLLVAATDISNAPKSKLGRSEDEDAYLRSLIKRQQDYISLMLPHTKLTKGEGP